MPIPEAQPYHPLFTDCVATYYFYIFVLSPYTTDYASSMANV